MNNNKTKIAGLLLVLVTLLTGLQGFIPMLPPSIGPHTVTLISAIVLYLVSTLTLWRQWVSKQIDNAALKPTIIVLVVATIGGLNDIFNVVHLSETVDQWVRFGITFTTFMLNFFSKIMYPTPETKSVI